MTSSTVAPNHPSKLKAATLNPALEQFWLTPARNRVLKGGRASSKSWDAAGFAIYLASNYKLRFLCARQIQKRIEDSVYALLKEQIYRFGLQNSFRILKNKIINLKTGSEFVFYGLWRHIEEIKSMEGIDVCWIEEAHSLTEAQWEILEPTVRKEHSQFWLIFNPKMVTDFIYQNFVINPPPDTIVRHINFDENPFLEDTILKVIASKKARDYEGYVHTYLGEPLQDDEQAIIKRSWVLAAIDAHDKLFFEPVGDKTVGYDVADSGEDKNATAYAHGSVLLELEEWKAGDNELLKSATRAYDTARRHNAKIIYDSIGVGASSGAKFDELNRRPANANLRDITFDKFVAGAAVAYPNKYYEINVKNKDMFSNLKAQAWWDLARRLRNTFNAVQQEDFYDAKDMVSISSEIPEEVLEQLIAELTTPRQDRDGLGKVKVESKQDLAKRGIASPNVADAAVMALSGHLITAHFKYNL